MDNREFARLLLIEATDLLESTGSHSNNIKFYEKRIERDQKFINDNKNNANSEDKGLTKKIADAEKRIEESKKIIKYSKSYGNDGEDYILAKTFPIARGIKKSNFLNPHQKILHNKINSRVQNESIAILLTEAALLLNEDAKHRN